MRDTERRLLTEAERLWWLDDIDEEAKIELEKLDNAESLKPPSFKN